jgi:hypothetical protein
MRFREWNPGVLVGVGLMAGAVQAAAGVAMYVAGVYFAPWSMAVSVGVLVLCIVVGTLWYTTHVLNRRGVCGLQPDHDFILLSALS